jgi:hypothetical protein
MKGFFEGRLVVDNWREEALRRLRAARLICEVL